MSDAYEALNQCLALSKDPISVERGEKRRGGKERRGREGEGEGEGRKEKKEQKRSDVTREKQSAKCWFRTAARFSHIPVLGFHEIPLIPVTILLLS